MDPLAPKVYADFYGITDVGRVRKGNEDNYLIADLQHQRRGVQGVGERWRLGGHGMLFAVCDGMGGAAAGEVASQMAVDVVYENLLDLEPGLDLQAFGGILDRAILQANHQIHTLAQEDTSKKGMGTTISAAAVYGNILFLAQVGDSRAYLLRNGTLTRVTKDQSLLEKLIEEGAISPEHAENFVGKNVILQALGPVPEVLVDLKFIELEHDDMVMLCSDGLHGEVKDQEIELIMKGSTSLEEIGKTLIDRANENGGHDNITAVVLRLTGEDIPSPETSKIANPQPLAYVRTPIDTITQRLEKELGMIHWINKYLFAKPLLIIYGILLLLGLLYGVFVNRVVLTKLFTQKVELPKATSKSSRLVVASDVMNASLYVDETLVGQLVEGGLSLTLPTGKYKIYLRTEGWSSKIRTIHLKAERASLVEINRDKKTKTGLTKKDSTKEWLPGQDPK